MTNDDRALRPVESGPGVLVHPTADRRLATEHWLLSTLADQGRARARMEWQEHGVAFLPLGTLFSAVRLPQRLVLAVAGERKPSADVDAFLGEVLDGGPVISDPPNRRYYALVPATMPTTWHEAVDDWRVMDVDCLGRDTYLGVPRIDLTESDRATYATYWSVPMPSMATLCAPISVARFIAAGKFQLDKQNDADEEGQA
ncbi:hypothetical protein AB0E00_35530 [Streptomyces sp. NPDC048110]|uniref:hypothetical protein n=1 Tax=Streptomyces sp. NPDC048110 TaxID=3155483 RepID=UPI0033E3AF1D